MHKPTFFQMLNNMSIICPRREMSRGMRKYFPAYKKVVYRAYHDRDFKNPVKRGELDEHLGIMGPVIKVEVNEVLTVSVILLVIENAS